MNSIVNDLNLARQQRLLVNVYQVDQDVVYTGYVTAISDTGIILATYDDYGLPDGAAYLDFDVIDEVEFSSEDLSNMEFRIETAQAEGLFNAGSATHHFTDHQHLVAQVLGHAWLDRQVVMVTLAHETDFYEGIITKLTPDRVSMQLINKFEFDHQPLVDFPITAVQLIEFQGRELNLESRLWPKLQALKHETPQQYAALDEVMAGLQQALEQHTLIAVLPGTEPDLFFVGWVNTITDDAVIMNVIDMTGQFGGYVLFRVDALTKLITRSDYLRTMQLFVSSNQAAGTTTQPVLNDERLFDGTIDQVQAIIEQQARFKRVFRIKTALHDSQLGYVSRVGQNRFVFHEVEDGQVIDKVGQAIRFDAVTQLAFDYLDAYLVEKQLRTEGEL